MFICSSYLWRIITIALTKEEVTQKEMCPFGKPCWVGEAEFLIPRSVWVSYMGLAFIGCKSVQVVLDLQLTTEPQVSVANWNS